MDEVSIFAPDLPIWAFWLIVVVSFFASALTAALSIGGGLLMIGLMSLLMPPAAVVPVHGVLLLGSNVGRAAILRRYMKWPLVISFATGALVGAVLGGLAVTNIPAAALRFSIAGFIIFTQWGPNIPLPSGRFAFRIVGLFSTILTLFVGATGPFVTTLLSKMPQLDRRQLVATAGGCMTVQHGLKVFVFGVAGFAYGPWLGLMVLALGAGFAGTVLGSKLLGWLPEDKFKIILKWMLTAMAIYLAFLALRDFF